MDILNSALSILIDVTKERETFHNALKSYFSKEENSGLDKNTTSIYVGCVLRHYYVLNAVAKDFCNESSDACKLAIGLAVANSLFLKRLESKTTVDFVEQVFKNEGIEFKKDNFEKFLQAKEGGEPLINPTLEKMSYEFISQRYNIPTWIAKMWSNNFSKNITFKTARAMTRNPIQYLRINTLLTDKTKMLASYGSELSETDKSNDLLVYNGKDHVRRKKYVVTNKMYQISYGVKELIDKLPIDTFKPCVIFSGNYNLVPLELGVKYNNALKIENLTTPNNDMFNFKNAMLRYQVKCVRTSECLPSQFVTAVSNKVSMFILLPKSSAFDRLRIDPDYFLNFDPSSLDELIENQKIAINGASEFIEDHGYLVYAVPTIDKKEGQNIVAQFLRNHHDFTLVEEVQHFPYDQTNSSLYYAILRKKAANE